MLSRRFHPDSLPHQGLGHLRDRSQSVFAALSEAYQRLSDDAQREQIAAAAARRPGMAPRASRRPERAGGARSEVVVREGDKLLRAGNFDRAIERYRKAAALNPDELEIRAALRVVRVPAGRRQGAGPRRTRAALFEVLARQPRCVRAHYDLGLLSLGSGDDDDRRCCTSIMCSRWSPTTSTRSGRSTRSSCAARRPRAPAQAVRTAAVMGRAVV